MSDPTPKRKLEEPEKKLFPPLRVRDLWAHEYEHLLEAFEYVMKDPGASRVMAADFAYSDIDQFETDEGILCLRFDPNPPDTDIPTLSVYWPTEDGHEHYLATLVDNEGDEKVVKFRDSRVGVDIDMEALEVTRRRPSTNSEESVRIRNSLQDYFNLRLYVEQIRDWVYPLLEPVTPVDGPDSPSYSPVRRESPVYTPASPVYGPASPVRRE